MIRSFVMRFLFCFQKELIPVKPHHGTLDMSQRGQYTRVPQSETELAPGVGKYSTASSVPTIRVDDRVTTAQRINAYLHTFFW
jgi:hypothetical protein